MSIPSNILNKFRTYSYHHILIVSDGMNTADKLSKQSEVVLFNRDTRDGLRRYTPRYLESNDTQGYVVLVDGMRDTQLSVSDVSWDTIIAPSRSTGGQKYGDTMELDGEITIIEPFGIRFLEILTNASADLGTDPSGLIFVLKTIFVGIRDDGEQETISTVRPLLFTMTDITSVIDTAGATYKMQLVGVNNGTAKLPQITRIADGVNIEIQAGQTVAAALKTFEAQLNGRYQQFKTDLNKQLQAAGAPIDVDSDFREVVYRINTVPVYGDPEYLAGNNTNVVEQGTPNETIIAAGGNATVESTIRKIMDSSKQVVQDASGKNATNTRYIYKIISTLLPDNDGDRMIVQYTVHRYEIVTQVVGQPLDPKPGEFIEFDYIFSGKNVDIIDFDIKMDMGLSFFYTLATARTLPADQQDVVTGIQNEVLSKGSSGSANGTADSGAEKSGQKRKRPRTPLFLGTTIKDPLIRNKSNPLDSATFDALLSRHAAFENIEAKMKIAGNPQLMDELLPRPQDMDEIGTEPASSGTTGSQNFLNTPSLVKVNIRFPVDNELTDFADFWYKGFYNLYSVSQSFSGGLFTQDLSMFSLPQTDSTDAGLSSSTDNSESGTGNSTNSTSGSASETTARNLTGQTGPQS